jgi:hypothetical protein
VTSKNDQDMVGLNGSSLSRVADSDHFYRLGDFRNVQQRQQTRRSRPATRENAKKSLAKSIEYVAMLLTRIGVRAILPLCLALACLPAETLKPDWILVARRVPHPQPYDCTGRNCKDLQLDHGLGTAVQSKAYFEEKFLATGNKVTFPGPKRTRISVEDLAAGTAGRQELDVCRPKEYEIGIYVKTTLRAETIQLTSPWKSRSGEGYL